MLADKPIAANIAVRDLPAARRFYEGVLGLTIEGVEGEELVAYKSGSSQLFVYRSEFAGTNRATAVTWMAGDDVVAIAGELRAKGVAFEHYDLPGLAREGDVHVGGGMRIAWFKDPDGNILSIASG